MKSLKRIMSFVFILVLVAAMIPATALAAETATETPDVNGSKKAYPTALSYDGEKRTTVTLSLPSAEYEKEFDVVFVMDKSSSVAGQQLDERAEALLEALVAKDCKVNVGVIKFRGYATDMLDRLSNSAKSGMIPYNSENKDLIKAAIKSQDVPGSGTNIHGGLDMANDLLVADKKVSDDHKYVILLTDAKTYIWNDENDVATSFFTQYYQQHKIINEGVPAINQQGGCYDKPNYAGVATGTKVYWFDSYTDLFNSTDAELTGKTKYDTYAKYVDGKGSSVAGTVTAHDVTNSNEMYVDSYTKKNIKADATNYSGYQKYYEFVATEDIPYMEANPYEVINNGDGTYTWDFSKPNPDYYQNHVDAMQKALYKTGHLWYDMDQKYNTAAIISTSGSNATGMTELRYWFTSWMLGETITYDKNEYKDGENPVKHGDFVARADNAEAVSAIFNSLEKEIVYMVQSGVVTDYISEEFTLVEAGEGGIDTFKVTLDGVELKAKPGANPYVWGYGEKADSYGIPLYIVHYDPTTRAITWLINTPVENAHPVTLSYKLDIYQELETGKYETNDSAVLVYTDTDGKKGEFTFEIPVVTYDNPYKTDYPGVRKVIVDGDNEVTEKIIKAGEVVNFKLSSNVPKDIKNYLQPVPPVPPVVGTNAFDSDLNGDQYFLAFHDTLDKELVLDPASIVVNVNGHVLTLGELPEYTVTIGTDENFNTTIDVKIELVSLYRKGYFTEAEFGSAPITVTYSATAKKDLKAGKYYNRVWVEYEGGKTEEVVVDVITYGIDIFKYDQAKPEKGLYNAKFDVYKVVVEEGVATEVLVGQISSDATGMAYIQGLDAGTYKIYETDAPEGYVKSDEPITVNIPADADSTFWAHVRFANSEIPHTGGAGVYAYTFGGAMMIAAAVLLMLKRRQYN